MSKNDSTLRADSLDHKKFNETMNTKLVDVSSQGSSPSKKAEIDYFQNQASNIKIIENKVVEAEKFIIKINGQINSRIGKRLVQEDSKGRIMMR